MSNIDFIDLFDDDNQGNSMGYSDNNEENLSPIEIGRQEKIPGSQRMRINDYKHSSQTLQHSTPRGKIPTPQGKPRSLKLDDEKIVWAGAIFVFFGVFVFLIGYWLGKATLKTVQSSNQQYLAGIQEKLDTEQLQNTMTMPLKQEKGKVDSITPDLNPEQRPSVNTLQAKNNIKTIVAPPIQDPDLLKPKAVIKHTTPVKKSQTVKIKSTQPTPQKIKGNFTLQVSAHTDMEKARNIESQLRAQGLQAYIVESMVNGVRYFRVRVGKFNSKYDASTTLSKLKKSRIGKDAYLINLN